VLTSGKPSGATRRGVQPPSSTARSATRRPGRPASQALKSPSGPYLVVLDRDEAAGCADTSARGGDPERVPRALRRVRSPVVSSPDRDLRQGRPRQPDHDADDRVARGRELFRRALADRYGADALAEALSAHSTRSAARPGPAGRRCRAPRGTPIDSWSSSGLQQQQHPHLARICANRAPPITSPTTTAWCLRTRSGHRRPARRPNWRPSGGCRQRSAERRPDGRSFYPRQSGRRHAGSSRLPPLPAPPHRTPVNHSAPPRS